MPFQFVAVGTSFGGFHALKTVFAEGYIYVCPPNYHLLVDGDHFALSMDAAVFHARPSIDVCLESAAAGRIMPKAATASVVVDKILPLEEIAPSLTALCVGQRTVV
jgi:chemotaxis response regulator CheB